MDREPIDTTEDQWLLALAEKRLANASASTYTAEEVYSELGIDIDSPNDFPIEFGVDFE